MTVREQYVLYDYNRLIADIGGYLGLFLGQSILTMIFTGIEMIKKKI